MGSSPGAWSWCIRKQARDFLQPTQILNWPTLPGAADRERRYRILTGLRGCFGHLITRETRKNQDDRKRWKLYEGGYERKEIANLFRFIDWIMNLPKELEQGFWQEIIQYEGAKKMRYMTTGERIGYKKGMQEGMQQGMQQGVEKGRSKGLLDAIEMGISIRFGAKGLRYLPAIRQIKDIDRLLAIKEAVKISDNINEIQAVLE